MAKTQEQLAKERADEAKLNRLSDEIIGKTPFGQLYPLMKLAASLGEGAIPHKICVDKDGRTVKVFKGDAGKLIGAFLKPTHEYVTQYVARKEYGKAFAASLGLYGQIESAKAQKSAQCITMTPNEIINLVNSVPSRDPVTGQRKAGYISDQPSSPGTSSRTDEFLKKHFTQKNVITTLVVIGSIGAFFGVLKLTKVI